MALPVNGYGLPVINDGELYGPLIADHIYVCCLVVSGITFDMMVEDTYILDCGTVTGMTVETPVIQDIVVETPIDDDITIHSYVYQASPRDYGKILNCR